jgi:anthranilate synthase component 2
VLDSPAFPRADRGVLLVDNYDSFTMNLAHALAQLGADVHVVRNDAIGVRGAVALGARGLVVSPGPLTPKEAGISVAAIRAFAEGGVPVFGVCLGHQAIGEAFGARVVRAVRPVHGRSTPIFHGGLGSLEGLRSPFPAARYHSLVLDPTTMPPDLEVTARSREGEVMAVRHRRLRVEGVQFHPESYLTPSGPWILAAFLRRCGVPVGRAPRVLR